MHQITAVFCCATSAGDVSRVRILIDQADCPDHANVSDHRALIEEDLALQAEAALSMALLNLYDYVSVEWIEVGHYTVLS